MADLSTHYKEITPEQTVKNVTDFFTAHNFTLQISDLNESEAKTWYCHVDLCKDGIVFGGANGKGMTREYALASGHAELYERFCNGMIFGKDPYWNKLLTKKNKEERGYYYRPDEKILSQEEVINSHPRVTQFLNLITENNKFLIDKFVDFVTDGQGVGLPMKSITDDNDIIYMDPRMMLRVNRSVGMCAGNTLEEALNQGISELLEVNVKMRVFHDWENMCFYSLKLENIQNPSLQSTINTILSAGYKLYIFDLSYNYKLPVVMSLIIDPLKNTAKFNVGAFPVFDIAAERVLTELYQGMQNFRQRASQEPTQIPYKSVSNNYIYNYYGNSINGKLLPVELFKHMREMDDYNHDIFIQATDNHTILDYFKSLKDIRDYKFYYLDNSLSPDIYALHIMYDNQEEMEFEQYQYECCWDDIAIYDALTRLNQYKNLYDGVLNDSINYSELLELINSNGLNGQFFGLAQMWNDLCVFTKQMESFGLLFAFMNYFNEQESMNYNTIIKDSLIEKQFRKYYTLRSYIFCEQYTNEEIFYIFNEVFNFDVTEEDIYNFNNFSYLVQQVFIKPLQAFLNSESYQEILNTYIK